MFIDIANEMSFIECKKNSEAVANKTLKTTIIRGTNDPSWVSKNSPQGESFELGMFMKKYPHFILIEVYHQKKKSMFGSDTDKELLGYAELHTENLISLDDYGQEFWLFLEDSQNKNSIIKIRSLFVPSPGTIERLRLDPHKAVFKNAQQFLFFKVLHMNNATDEFGYPIPLGKYIPELENAESQETQA